MRTRRRFLRLCLLLLLAANAWGSTASTKLLLAVGGGNGPISCSANGALVQVQIGYFPGQAPYMDVNPFNEGQVDVLITQNSVLTGAPFRPGDIVMLSGTWDGLECVATSIVKQ